MQGKRCCRQSGPSPAVEIAHRDLAADLDVWSIGEAPLLAIRLPGVAHR